MNKKFLAISLCCFCLVLLASTVCLPAYAQEEELVFVNYTKELLEKNVLIKTSRVSTQR